MAFFKAYRERSGVIEGVPERLVNDCLANLTFTGTPDEIESHPSGGSYVRSPFEGGGETSTYPFETWRYRYIDGIGHNIILEFVDPSMTGEYRLTMDPQEKDALLHVPGARLTMYEAMGMRSKADRFIPNQM